MKTLISISFIIIFANAIFAQDGWHWQNPYLQGNDLNSIVMNGVVGWAVGDMGTVMRTKNSGHDWQLVDLRTSENLNCIYMNEITNDGWIVGDNGIIFYTSDAGETWSKQYSGTRNSLYSITATGGDCPWICGNDIILRGMDDGESWVKINSPFHTYFWEVDQKDCDEIWISGNQSLVMSTKDHGVTWQKHDVPTTYNLMGIDVVANGDYRACGNQSVIIRSSDAGENWIKEYQAPFINMYAVETRGIGGPAYAVGDKGVILETLDGGTTWNTKQSGTIYQLNDVCFQAIYHAVYATGWYGQVVKKEESDNAQFEVLNKKPNHWMMDVDFINADTGWVVGGESLDNAGTKEGVILRTVDGGKTWETQLTKPYFFNSVDFINKNVGWAVGSKGVSNGEGVILHTNNGGQTWTSQANPIIESIDKVFFLDENNGWVVSNDWWGQIAHTTNGGHDWILQKNPTKNPIVDVFFITPQKGWAVGMDSTILRTVNGGLTWQRTELTVSNNWYFRSVFFIDEMHGWAVGVYGVIMLTDDGGVTWKEVVNGHGETLQSVFFFDAINGWAVGDAGTVLRSIDGGYTWFNQYSGIRRNFLCSVQFTDLNNGWISGEGGTIKHTLNGGFWNEPGAFIRNRLHLPIRDLSETRDTLIFEGSGLKAKKSSYQLVGLEVMIDSVMHTKANDLDISLSHNGITEKLVSGVNNPGPDFLWTRLSDGARSTITDGKAPFSGNYKPYHPLTAFNGLDPEGPWILKIYDSKIGNTGTLNAWGIKPLYEKLSTVGTTEPISLKPGVNLFQNVPNPFELTTRISWESNIDGFATLKLYNIGGQEIATLMNKFMPKGEYFIQFDGSQLGAGVYYYQLKIGLYTLTKKCIVL
ncbi:MAG: YCF48-related protein [Bacteroidales bacterium]